MFRFLLKLVVSALLLTWVLSKTDLTSVGHAFSQCHFGFLLLAFGLHFVGLLISVVRWKILYQAIGGEISFLRLLNSYLVGFFFNTFLPSTVGGDISRSLDFKKDVGGAQSFAAVFVERFSGLLAMILMAALALPLAQDVIPKGFYIIETVIGMSLFFFLFVAVILWPPTSRFLGTESKLAQFHKALVVYSKHLNKLGMALLLGFLLQVNVVFHYYFLCLGLGLDFPILFLFVIIPILKIVLLFPLTVNGIGLRENIFVYFFKAKGSTMAAAVALSWLDLGMVLIFALVGGIVYVVRGKSSANR